MIRFLFLVLFVLMLGCDAGPAPGPVVANSITGTWSGTVPSTNVEGRVDIFRVEMQILESVSNVSGMGTVTGPNGENTFTVAVGSSYLHPLLSVNLLFGQPPLGDLKGNVSDDRMSIRGTMTGPGFSGVAELEIVMRRVLPQ